MKSLSVLKDLEESKLGNLEDLKNRTIQYFDHYEQKLNDSTYTIPLIDSEGDELREFNRELSDIGDCALSYATTPFIYYILNQLVTNETKDVYFISLGLPRMLHPFQKVMEDNKYKVLIYENNRKEAFNWDIESIKSNDTIYFEGVHNSLKLMRQRDRLKGKGFYTPRTVVYLLDTCNIGSIYYFSKLLSNRREYIKDNIFLMLNSDRFRHPNAPIKVANKILGEDFNILGGVDYLGRGKRRHPRTALFFSSKEAK